MSNLFNKRDVEQIEARGMTLEKAVSQIESLRRGLPHARLHQPCTVGDGITVIEKRGLEKLAEIYSQASLSGRTSKFVPASGAASRMFQTLISLRDRPELMSGFAAADKAGPENRSLVQFFSGIKRFAFYDDLKSVMSKGGLDIEGLIAKGRHTEILEYLLTGKGLNYGKLPKGLIRFHRYPDHCRTPIDEQLVEAAATVQDKNGVARVHFTVSPEHKEAVESHVEMARSRYEKARLKFEIGVSIQKPSTDTLAVDLDNRPFRDRKGKLVFRPGGHGALLENLNDLGGDIVFIKNIDNVVPDRLKEETTIYKKALGGFLVELQREIFDYLRRLSMTGVSERDLAEAFEFASCKLSIAPPDGFDRRSVEERTKFLFAKLNRPLRVCGVVRALGEPGGGPFWVGQGSEATSSQIVESSQVDMESAEQRAIWTSSTHFNPVDLVCGLRDYLGEPFDLVHITDPEAGFISIKSVDGRQLKALELPGLWNGAMARWNTIFIEVPLVTFNPVKTVFDLLQEVHQDN
ncbi:MAG: DUF4301 family protein [Deltaproteobacteria bacterium]|nr:DUF4301 family protein [Deltaproteobacteria bacterium]